MTYKNDLEHIGMTISEIDYLTTRMKTLGYDKWFLGGWFDHNHNNKYLENAVMVKIIDTPNGDITITHLYNEDDVLICFNGQKVFEGDYDREIVDKGFSFPEDMIKFTKHCIVQSLDNM